MENKVIFENEKEARKIYEIQGCSFEEWINNLKEQGYIRKDIVKEAEEMYHNWNQSKPKFIYDDFIEVKNLCVILYEAIQYLKSKLEEKK